MKKVVKKKESVIEEIDKEIEALQKKKKAFIIKSVAKCKHPVSSVVEGEYKEFHYLNSCPPFRVCKDCGYAEEGWGCGYNKLDYYKVLVPTVQRDYAEKYVLYLVWQNGEIDIG